MKRPKLPSPLTIWIQSILFIVFINPSHVNQAFEADSIPVSNIVDKTSFDKAQFIFGANNSISKSLHRFSNSGTLCKVAIFTENSFVNDGIIRNKSHSAPPMAAKLPFATIKLGRTFFSDPEYLLIMCHITRSHLSTTCLARPW